MTDGLVLLAAWMQFVALIAVLAEVVLRQSGPRR